MMRKTVLARLYWISKAAGGRNTIVLGENLLYCPIIRFTDETSKITWSSKITKSIYVDELTTDIDLSYLVDSAPFELLQANKSFSLYEGSMLVAKGIILSE